MNENFSDFLLTFITRDNLSRECGSQRLHHLCHDSLKSTQEAVADIQLEHIRSLQLTAKYPALDVAKLQCGYNILDQSVAKV